LKYTDFIEQLCSCRGNALILGFAGTGKSTLIKNLSIKMGDRCLKLTPTGQTASNIDGITIDSLLECYRKKPTSTINKIMYLYDCIIIDEISMVHYFKLDIIYKLQEKLAELGKKICIIMVGDIFQLPPVITKDMKKAYSKLNNRVLDYDDFLFFQSEYFQKDTVNNLGLYILNKNYRQNNQYFEEVLQKIATGFADKHDLEYINQRVIKMDLDTFFQHCPILVPHRYTVKYFNNRRLQYFDQRDCNYPIYEKVLKGYEEVDEYYQDITEPIYYARFANIVFNQNNIYEHWANGTRGIITNFEIDYFGNKSLEIRIENGNLVKCKPTLHYIRRFIYNESKNSVDTENVAIIKQFPFILGFAITIHKAQGMTLESMTFNVASGTFADGQIYVALSRVRDIKDLYLHVPISIKDIKVSTKIKEFYNDFTGKCIEITNEEQIRKIVHKYIQ
jgi:ATP-dependent exoDNAse (exonuclease V) alpha subunit